LTADKLVEDTSAGVHSFRQDYSTTVTGSFFVSIYAKAAERSFFQFVATTAFGNSRVNFDLTNGTITTQGVGVTGTIESAGNGWWRCIVSATSSGSGTIRTQWCLITSGTAERVESYTGDGTSGIFIWGAQLVEGTDAKPYFATTNRQDVPRLDYRNADGTLNSCPRLLLEPQRTNNLAYSQDIANAYWSKSDITFGADGLSPGGLIDADLVITGTANSDQIQRNIVLPLTNTITQSVFIKRVAGDWIDFIAVRNGFSNSVKVWFNILTGEVGGNVQAGTTILNSASIENYGNGWFRIIVTTTDTLTNTFFDTRIRSAIANSSDTRFNNASYYVYGFQLEAAAYATTYIPTTTAAVTRLADTASKTGISSLIGQTEGVLFIDMEFEGYDGLAPKWIAFLVGSGLTYIGIYTTNNSRFYFEVYNVSIQASATSSAFVVGQRYKLALAYKANDFAFYVNGVQIGTDNSGTVPATSRFDLQYNTTENNLTARTYNQAALFPTRLTNAQLAEITTL
jgi:hypothetical protein